MSYSIKEIENNLRPRERFIKYGVKSLADDELLAILFRCGIKNKNVKEISNDLLTEIGGIKSLKEITMEELSKREGIGIVKSMELLSAIELAKRVLDSKEEKIKIINHENIYNMFKYEFIGEKQEKFIACSLDNKNQLISYKVIFIGTLNGSIVYPRKIFKEAVSKSCAKIILLHNHPSGNPLPSLNDELFTEKMIKLGNEMDIPLIEHLIIGNNRYYSLIKKREYLNEKNY